MIDLLAPDDAPTPAMLRAWFEAAHTGAGTPFLPPDHADALARYALLRGEGVSMMEAVAPAFRDPPRDVSWEILGDDAPGQNWHDHRDPQRAYALFRQKLDWARRDRARLDYKLWLRPAGDA
ncbi:hypothetical protein [Tropicibacter naphthalenivorans]|uniref:Uncharacterized protein n=1 Tax=Tropicibacter naphthalenivorans TaxID=441103 RepID=A0A0P1GDJ1_9RHOB|nr:hypothetical protein [Tropicibacter naphthalenivorans]CUH79362.1 hypothetical protein TRN7648_02432 [Tropicibacter naphthalenivorans]SMC71612.1 hypothetical protein SAMN04488093_10362 [Tropicibacter naphthalenivorans]